MTKQLKPALFVLVALFLIATNNKSFCAKTEKIHSLDTISGWIAKDGYWEQKLKVGEITFIKYSEDGKYFYTFGTDKIFRKWESESGLLIKDLMISYNYMTDLDFDPINEKIGVITNPVNHDFKQTKAYIFYLEFPDSIIVVEPSAGYEDHFSDEVTNCLILINGNINMAITLMETDYDIGGGGGNSGRCNLWDLKSGKKIDSIYSGFHNMSFWEMSSKGNYIAGFWTSNWWSSPSHGDEYEESYGFSLTDFKRKIYKILFKEEKSPSFKLNNITFSHDGKYVCFLTDNYIYTWNSDDFVSHSFKPLSKIIDADFLMNDNYLLSCNSSNQIHLYHVPHAEIFYKDFPLNIKIDKVKVSPDSISFLGTSVGKLWLFKLDSLKQSIRALFDVNSSKAFVNVPINFKNRSLGNPDKFFWDFGDGKTSTEVDPVHSYTQSGNYTVSLEVTLNGLKHKIIKENYILVRDTIVPDFIVSHEKGTIPMEVIFTDKSIGNILTWKWDFGDKTTSNQQNPIHIYEQFGNYKVSLTVSDTVFYYTKTYDRLIEVIRSPIENLDVKFEKDFGTDEYRWEGFSGIECFDGGYAICGHAFRWIDSVYGEYDSFNYVLRLNQYGDTLWTRRISKGISIQQTTDGCFILVDHTNKNHSDFLVIKLDPNGNEVWQNIYGTGADDDYQNILATPDGGFIIIGHSYFQYPLSALILKCDNEGKQEFVSSYPGDGGEIICTTDGGYAILSRNGSSFFVIKINQYGAILWQKSFSSKYSLFCRDIIEYNRGIVISGQKDKNVIEIDDPGFIFYLDNKGETLWEFESPDSWMNYLSIAPYNKGLAVTGDLSNTFGLRLIDNFGVLNKSLIFRNRKGVINSLVPTRDGGLFAVGTIHPPFSRSKIFSLRINGEINGIISEEKTFVIPNPNLGVGIVKFRSEHDGNVEIKLYSITGVEQAVLENNFYVSGYHEIPFNLNNFSQGIYFYTISLNNKFLDSGKLIIVE